ncbi:MAG TPA: PPOX class F420-dependent oxidoreductase [Thermomonospora sp.]|nr:PPOX class F420-dependent oxidoreductase [Thermomonospora sp.]
MTFTDAERVYLTAQHLGCLASLGPGGGPQVKPVAYRLDPETDVIDIGGPWLTASQKYRNIAADPRVSFVVHDEAEEPVGPGGQRGRGLEIRGTAELLTLEEPMIPGFTKDVIRVHARRIVAWNIDGPGPNFRDVAPPGAPKILSSPDGA